MSYLFVFGRSPELAFLELKTLYPDSIRVTETTAVLSKSTKESIDSIMDSLGGTVKIAQILGHNAEMEPKTVASFLTDQNGQVTFGVSVIGNIVLSATFVAEMKKELEKKFARVRYIVPKHGTTLSSVSVDKSHIQELILVDTPSGRIIAKTVTVQPYEAWNTRDYKRPFNDPKSGMLPPKVARMIVNIASGQPADEWKPGKYTLYDPFCGMGTVLAEAYMRGWRVIGSDIKADTVKKAQSNLQWLVTQHPDTNGRVETVFSADAVHIPESVNRGSIHTIVTEPFMGSTAIVNNTSADLTKIKHIIKGLEKLYIGCLREWRDVLNTHGTIVIALPSYTIMGRTFFVKNVVDMCEKLGYTIVVGPIEYSRPQAIVKREFFVFRKK